MEEKKHLEREHLKTASGGRYDPPPATPEYLAEINAKYTDADLIPNYHCPFCGSPRVVYKYPEFDLVLCLHCGREDYDGTW